MDFALPDIDDVPVPSWVKTDVATNNAAKRKSESEHGGGGLVVEVLLCKGQETPSPSAEKENGLAPLFCKPVAAKKKESPTFPEEFRDALKRKRNVNLYISGGRVVWEFAYNARVIQAIKEHIKGRTWNPSLKCWTCPLESLPDSIALFEFMGRSVDDSLKKRANEIEASYGGSSASDAIKLAIELDLIEQEQDDDGSSSIGSVLVTFLYDADVVSALKMLSPVQRSYNPETKAWSVDILALPELLEHLEPLGFHPSPRLQEVAKSCSELENLLWNQELTGSEAQPIDIDADEEEKALPIANEGDRAQLLEDGLKRLVSVVGNMKKSEGARKLDRSDCGQAKRRRTTDSQAKWSARNSRDFDFDSDDDFDDDFGYDSFFGGDLFSSFTRRHLRKSETKSRVTSPALDCDCGQPWKRVGGKHVCRYFGTFHCRDCGNQWTSAYCWKDEKQACRGCNRESLPVKKDQLDGRPSKRTGAHDSARCAMCKRLGYDCSLC